MEIKPWAVFVLCFCTGGVFCDTLCNYEQDVVPGVVLVLYPRNYSAGADCFWRFRSAIGTHVYLSCNINIPLTTNCSQDILTVWKSGLEYSSLGDGYCGKQYFSTFSENEILAVGLVSSWNSPGGELNCEITSIRNETEPVPDRNTGCDCGMEGMTRITGGQETGINQFPFMAGVIYKEDFFCGCTIIANRYLLTAGHCIYQTNPDDLLILVGDHDLSTGRDTNASKLYHVSAYEIHPWFNMTSWRNDIGIIQTSTVIKFGPAIGPVCLPFKHTYYDFAGQTGTILGWGVLKFSGVRSNTLQRADLTILSTRQCNFFDQPPTSYNELCTYEKEKDSCQHDSGGPVIWYDTSTERYVLVGIISHGKPCPSNTPGLNTRVTEYLQWIIDRTGRDTGYCVK